MSRRSWRWTIAQVACVGVVGGFAFSHGAVAVMVFWFAMGPIALVLAALFGVGVLYVIGMMTPYGSPLTESSGGRLAWASGVLVLGTIGWVAGAVFVGAVMPTTDLLWSAVLSMIPFALAATLLAGGWASIIAGILAVLVIVSAVIVR
ncbi:hypothetical protein [Nonomuraea typhae]|uniref:hypothetical protein n=1 Tax=Nonomuraea typhae TaxID=2603600 RepID=UPI0012F83503|nr:hypothetical protein [Nonomuraea typhae]